MPQSAPPLNLGWHLQEWLTVKHKRQADILRDLEWDRARTSRIISGKQPFTRDDVLALAKWLQIEPYELLMPPQRAAQLRAIEQSTIDLAAAIQAHSVVEPPGQSSQAGAPRSARPEPRKLAKGR